MAGLEDTFCPLCHTVNYSQAHILCECPQLDPFRREQLFSINSAALRIPAGPQRSLVRTFIDMATTWLPLDERALLWTGMPNKKQRANLQPLMTPLSTSMTRSLLQGVGRNFARATRTIWELFRSHVSETLTPSSPNTPHSHLDAPPPVDGASPFLVRVSSPLPMP